MSNLGEINDFFIKKLAAMPVSSSTPAFDKFAEKSAHLTALGVDSDKKFKRHFFIKKAEKELGIVLSLEEKKELLKLNINNLNDAYYSVVRCKTKDKKITKIAYPNIDHYREEMESEFDINRWLKTVHLIYDSVSKSEMTKENALDYYSNFLDIDRDEDLKFIKWFKYYSTGEHLKYSSKEDKYMKKESVYMSNLGQGGTPYYHGGQSAYLNKGQGNNMPGDSFHGSVFDETVEISEQKAHRGEQFGSWKSKLHTAIRRIDKLLRTDKYMDSETYKTLAEHLMNLSLQVQMLKLSSTLSDVTHNTANKLNKFGCTEGAEILKKIAQEVPEEMPIEASEAPVEAPVEAPAEALREPSAEALGEEGGPGPDPEVEEETPPGPADGIPSSEDVESVKFEDIAPLPGARPGEYEELAGDINIEDAARKLDEVAGMLADRRIIRQLAEFDIMLDKIGIASMFPELAESQSKLIDSFSYALTRVTKMMGQLANAKTLADAQSVIPGAEEEVAAEPIPEAEPTPEMDELGPPA